jgi:serine/threonine-protein kinase
VRFGPYWLDARLAVGGTAEVYLARPADPSVKPARLVVKRLLGHIMADPDGRSMFAREAALHAAVHHANVVEVYGAGLAGDEPWLAMELVDGCDLSRLLRRLAADGRKLGVLPSIYVARELLAGLEAVHSARDEDGKAMTIVHRDVTPSNVYLGSDGRVKLGDFGIAHTVGAQTTSQGAMLKGKFAYLAPEQVSGEPFDHRADLFATAVVLAEMLLGKPLFAGSGQLAVLLAIRDCRITPLRDARGALPPGLFEVLERALARDPAKRFPSATAFATALAPFGPEPGTGRAELGPLVRWVQSAPSMEMPAVREPAPAPAPRATSSPASGFLGDPDEERTSQRPTSEYSTIPSYAYTADGRKLGPWTFARLVEAVATGEITYGDTVDYMQRGSAPIESIDDLVRFLPTLTPSTTANQLAAIGSPDFVDDVNPEALVTVLLRIVERSATGVLFAEGPPDSRRVGPDSLRAPGPQSGALGEGGRKELYFLDGKLHHVSSNNAGELLGEYLVRKNAITRDERDFALAVLPRYGGRIGDTLVALGLMSSLDIFHAIRDQGRDRIVDLFRWRSGRLSFYSGQAPRHVEFPLDLDVPPLIMAGAKAAEPGDKLPDQWREHLDDVLGPAPTLRPKLRDAAWPPLVRRLLEVTDEPKPLRLVLSTMAVAGATPGDTFRALAVVLAAKLVAWQ